MVKKASSKAYMPNKLPLPPEKPIGRQGEAGLFVARNYIHGMPEKLLARTPYLCYHIEDALIHKSIDA